MKKFLADNITWIVVIALVLAGFAVYKIMKADGKIPASNTNTSTSGNTEKE